MTTEHPEGWTPGDGVDVQAALKAIEAEADGHGGDYAAGLRHAKVIVKEET